MLLHSEGGWPIGKGHSDSQPPGPRDAGDSLQHFLDALPVAFHETFLPRRWCLFFVAAPLVVLAGRKALARRPTLPFLVLAAAPPLLGLAAYAVHWNPAYLASVTWNRFLLHGSMGTLVVLSFALRPIYLATTNRRGG